MWYRLRWVPILVGRFSGWPASTAWLVSSDLWHSRSLRRGGYGISTDTVSCFATNADDANMVMEIMAGRDDKDMTTLPDFLAEPARIYQEEDWFGEAMYD